MTMTDRTENRPTDDMDAELSAHYQRLAKECAPDKLNHAVLRASRQEISGHTASVWQAAWFRPAAAVAVVTLSLAVVLEISDTNMLPSHAPGSNQVLPADSASDSFRDAANRATEQVRQATDTASRRSQNSAADAPMSMDTGMSTEQNPQLPASRACDTAQRATKTAWWACIESLESSGARNLAERELAALLLAFPALIEPGQ